MKKLFVCLFAVPMALVLVGSAVAADWSFYGSARMGTWWYANSNARVGLVGPDAMSTKTRYHSDFDLSHFLQSNARIGATVSSGDVSGRFEYGASGGKANIRILRGTWSFGPGELTVGQDYTPISWTWYSNQVVNTDEGLLSLGLMYAGRKPMLQFKAGGFKLALIQPNVVTSDGDAVRGVGYDTDVVVPKVELAYRQSTDIFFVDVGAGYQTYDYTDRNDENRATLTSWVVGVGGGYYFGPGYAKLQLNYDTNGAAYGLARYAPEAVFTSVLDAGGDFTDPTRLGAALSVGGQINDMIGVELGAGMQQYTNKQAGTGYDIENNTYALYLQFPFKPADGVTITPEIGYMDWGDVEVDVPGEKTNIDGGDTTYFGLYSRINF